MMFAKASNVVVLGGTFQQFQGNHVQIPTPGFERLQQAASPSAFHNSGDKFDQPKCHPKTRVALLEKITKWIDGVEDQNTSVMWVNGGAGIGKSAIARTMAERLAEEKRLLASFFFSRTDPTRNKANRLVPTIAYHAALHIPELREPIIRAVDRDPLIFNLSLNAQFSSLLTDPIHQLSESGYFDSPARPRVIIIDGLDECEDHMGQVTILNEIANALQKGNFPLLFLIASRPEHHLSTTFASGRISEFYTRLTVDNSFFPDNDIRFYLEDQFEELKTTHPFRAYLPPIWPNPIHIRTLVRKSSSQFIYASTVIKYISSLRQRPNQRLDIILGLRPPRNENPFSELDALYTHIFSSIEADRIELVLDILAVTILKNPYGAVPFWNVPEIESFLSLDPGDIDIALCDLGSIVCIQDNYHIVFLHASLPDFLMDPFRSGAFFINTQLRHTAFARRCFKLFKTPDYKLPYSWYGWLAAHCKDADFTPELRRDILDFSLPTFRARFFDGAGIDKRDLTRFMYQFLAAMASEDSLYDHIRQKIDEYHMIYIGNYYSDPPHTFLVALVGIGARWDDTCETLRMYIDSTSAIDLYPYNRSNSLDSDNLNLHAVLSRDPSKVYTLHLRSFLCDPSRSVACVLDGTKFAIAALHALKYLCDGKSRAHFTQRTDHAREIRRTRSWVWRQRVGQNAKALRTYQRRHLKRKRWFAFPYPPDKPLENLKVVNEYLCSRAYRWALQCFCQLLAKSGGSKELLEFASRHSFAALCQDSPRQTRLARKAITRYINTWEGVDIAD